MQVKPLTSTYDNDYFFLQSGHVDWLTRFLRTEEGLNLMLPEDR